MNIWVKEVRGIADAIAALYFSKWSWTREKEEEIRRICHVVNSPEGRFSPEINPLVSDEDIKQYKKWIELLSDYGCKDITLLKFIDISVTVEGLHRAGQDDWDAHAKRFDNRIIRASTRENKEVTGFSDYYKDRVMTTDMAAEILDIDLPSEFNWEGKTYVKSVNGYIVKGEENNPDVKRGLYSLGFPSNFIFVINLAEWSHVYKLRNSKGHAHPEVQQLCEGIADILLEFQPFMTRELFESIKN